MNTKREILNAFIGAVEEIESTSSKVVHFSVGASSIYFYVVPSAERYTHWITGKAYNLYWGGNWDGDKQLLAALDVLASIKAIPDAELKEQISVTITKEKAKELGLIA